jgi:2-haloacid dehalogenase
LIACDPDSVDAVVFDLLTGLLDSWSLWDSVAGNSVTGDDEAGRRWRARYLRLTYAAGDYRPYVDLVAEAARDERLDPRLATELVRRWDELAPWPEAASVIARLSASRKIAVVTNCSEALGRRAVDRVGGRFDVVVTAERAGAYKPRPEPYQLALDELGLPATRVLFVAGSPFDIEGAGRLGMPVWWHNRVGLSRGDGAPPVAEHDSLDFLVTDLAA